MRKGFHSCTFFGDGLTKLTGRKFLIERQFTTGGPIVVIGGQSGVSGYAGIAAVICVL